MDFKDYLLHQLRLHPVMQPQDVMKLCFQAAFGAEHLLADAEAARTYFDREYASVPACPGALYEQISEDVCRISLPAWKASGMPAEWLFRMFAHSAGVISSSAANTPDSRDAASASTDADTARTRFFTCLDTASDVIAADRQALSPAEHLTCSPVEHLTDSPAVQLAFSPTDWQAYLTAYLEKGIAPVHHSETYRASQHPAYRIVKSAFLRILPVLEQTARLPEAKMSADRTALVLAIDGRAASGKTTVAELLSVVLDTDIIHMDDFFLPPALRTRERLAAPGGNVHYERFAEEVLPHLSCADAFSYTIFDCGRMDYHGKQQIKASRWHIVEGSYSHHPYFGEYADLKIYSQVDPEEQMRRILRRNGQAMAENFRTRWIPMEEAYFSHYQIREKADQEI